MIVMQYILGEKFNKSLDNLPDTIRHIHFNFWSKFNQKNTQFPSSLKRILFGPVFNQKLDSLPNTVKILRFWESSNFN